MSDYIKRSDALNFDLEIECEPDDLQPMMEGMVRVMDYIKKLPAADVVEVVHGEWIRHVLKNANMPWGYDCSVCGGWFTIGEDTVKRYQYCPNCGAKMDGGDHDAVD